MSENSKIEWTDHTFNPWIGCTRVSPGCDNCYAAVSTPTRVMRIKWGAGESRQRTSASTWKLPRRWNAKHDAFFASHGRRQRVFCASLADVFDNAVDPQWRVDLFRLIDDTPNLDWLLLTKRVGNVEAMIQGVSDRLFGSDALRPAVLPDNVWLGVTIVNQEEADRDIPKLLEISASVRFLSMEPLLGAVDISRFLDPTGIHCMDVCPDSPYVVEKDVEVAEGGDEVVPLCPHCGEAASWTGYDDGIDWVIVGGESGAGARPMHPSWPRAIRDQCIEARVPFLFKQWGEWTDEDWGERAGLRDSAGVLQSGEYQLMSQGYSPPFDDGKRLEAAGNVRLDGRMLMDRVGKRAAGRELDGVTHDGFPEAQ